MRSLIGNSAVLTFGQAASQLMTAISYWVIARWTSPGQFGTLLAGVGLAIIFIPLVDFGLNSLAIRTLARGPANQRLFTDILSIKVIVGMAVCILWTIVSIVGHILAGVDIAWIPLGLYIFLSSVSATLQVPFRAKERMTVVALSGIVEKVVMSVSCLTLLVFTARNTISLPISMGIGSFASIITMLLLITDRPRLVLPRACEALSLWRRSFGFALSGFLPQLQRLDVLVVTSVSGPLQGAFFGAPARLVSPLTVVSTSFGGALFPSISRGWDNKHMRRSLYIQGSILMGALSLCFVGLFVFAKPIVVMALGTSYLPSIFAFRVYFLTMIVLSLNQPLAVFLQAMGHDKYVGILVGLATTTSLVIVYLGSSVKGSSGAALGYGIANLLVLIFLVGKAVQVNKPACEEGNTVPMD